MKKRSGFALLELLVVMGIIGLLVPFGFGSIKVQTERARDFRRKSDLQDIKIAMEQYYSAANAFPATIPFCGESFQYKSDLLLREFPCDPLTRAPYTYLTDSLIEYQWYKVYTHLERHDDTIIEQIGCQDGCGPECAYNYGVASTNISITACIWATPLPTSTPEPTAIPTISTLPTDVTTPTSMIPTSTPQPTQLNYVCAPGGGDEGSCEVFDDPDRSLCPFVYLNDPTCQNQCYDKENKCKNSSGKYKPE